MGQMLETIPVTKRVKEQVIEIDDLCHVTIEAIEGSPLTVNVKVGQERITAFRALHIANAFYALHDALNEVAEQNRRNQPGKK